MTTKPPWLWIAAAVVLGTAVFGAVRLRSGPKVVVPEGPLRNADVERVYSGHKVKLDSGEALVYAGIRAPIKGELLFEEATRRNAELTEGEDVRVRFDTHERNKKGQLEAYVSVSDGMVNELLVREGLAYVRLTTDTRRFADKLLAAQAEARKKRRGVWEHARRLDRPGEYPADPKYGNYHRADCDEVPKIKPERRVTFKTAAAALDEGFAPCSKCRP